MDADLPVWSMTLRHLYWRYRMTRETSRPTKRTLQRKIAQEKARLTAAGLSVIEVHLVCRVLCNPANRAAQRRWSAYVEQTRTGVSAWQRVPG
jgi:hypothetical protein